MSKIDFTQVITAEDKVEREEAEKNELQRLKALRYLADTDWYVTRAIETRKAVPKNVSEAREQARKEAGG